VCVCAGGNGVAVWHAWHGSQSAWRILYPDLSGGFIMAGGENDKRISVI